jgi:hypothetical protein
MEVSDQFYVYVTLLLGKGALVPIGWVARWARELIRTLWRR